jgi:hypothetical protein
MQSYFLLQVVFSVFSPSSLLVVPGPLHGSPHALRVQMTLVARNDYVLSTQNFSSGDPGHAVFGSLSSCFDIGPMQVVS